jgi:hypothetical protein
VETMEKYKQFGFHYEEEPEEEEEENVGYRPIRVKNSKLMPIIKIKRKYIKK